LPRREITALVCLAAAVFLGFVVYVDWSGGPLGRWLVDACRSLVGLLVYLVPPLLVYLAYVLAVKEERRPCRATSVGLGLLCLAFMLAAAADVFGLFAGSRPIDRFDADYLSSHGGVIGEGLYVSITAAGGGLGASIVVVMLTVVGLLLATGSSLGLWARHSASGARAAGRAARRSAGTLSERRAAAADFRRQAGEQDETAVLRSAAPDDQALTAVIPGSGGGLAPASGAPAWVQEPPRPPKLVDAERDLADLFAAGNVAGHVDAGSAASHAGVLLPDDDGEEGQLSLADEAEAVDDHESALAFEPPETRAWRLPNPNSLHRIGPARGEAPDAIEATSAKLVETLGHFGIEAWVVDTVSGPRVTRYELQLAPGTKVSRVSALKDDIAYALAATDIRIQAPIPGKSAVGVEVPNRQPSFVALGDIYGDFPHNASPLAFWLGQDISGKAVLADLARLVHVLIAGTTGSGKSQCINGLITSILLRATPDDVRLILIDPKKVELSHFDGIPHLLAPVVTQHKMASAVLTNVVHEMERRYEFMLRTDNAQKIKDLNRKLVRMGEKPLPYIVVVIDELADLMMVAPAEVEHAVIRLGQMGRAVGIHMVVATQRPSVDVVTGLIKTNVPSRIAFAVSSQIDSRVILDSGGAESLLGEGDMLFHPYTSAKMLRVQGVMVSPEEMKLVTEHWRLQAAPEFNEELLEGAPAEDGGSAPGADEDELLTQAIETVVRTGAASVALLQRRLRVGYARAGRLIDIMETKGIVSGYDGSKARRVLIEEHDLSRFSGAAPAAAEEAFVDDDAEPYLGAVSVVDLADDEPA